MLTYGLINLGTICNKYTNQELHLVKAVRVFGFPRLGVLKLNVDASLEVDGWVDLGAIARDSSRKVVFAATRRMQAHWSIEVAEAKAIEMVMRLGKSLVSNTSS